MRAHALFSVALFLPGCVLFTGFLDARCGDGVVDLDAAVPEQCDDKNAVDGDGCSAACQLEFTCGNAVVEAGETCDDGAANADAPDACRTICALPLCGDGIVDPGFGEECDDANNVDGDGCEADCSLICGAGTGADGAVLDAANNHCYLLFGAPLIWQDAQDDCVAKAGHLAAIANAEENALVATLSDDDFWIGLNDIAVEALTDATLFVWVTGEPFTFNGFDVGEPNQFQGTEEDCVQVLAGLDVWNDILCDQTFAYVCEIE